MSKKEVMSFTGKVSKCLPGAKFLVHIEEANLDITCSLSGKLRQNKIRICDNDIVDVETSLYDFTTGRIVWRR